MSTTTTTISTNIITEDLESSISNDIMKIVLKKNELPITRSKTNTSTKDNKSNINEPYNDIKWLTGC